MTPNQEFKQGWKVVLAASLGVGTGLSPLPFYTIGVFVRPLSAEFGWTVDQILVALIVTTLSVLVASPVVGILTDKYGVRRVALASTVGFGLSFVLFAFNPGSLPLFYANYALLSVAGTGTLPITWTRAVNNRFKRSRGLALGLALLLTGVFGSLSKIYANWIIDLAGWRIAYAALAAFPLVISLPVAIAFFHDVDEPVADSLTPIVVDDGLSLRQAFATWQFWAIGVALILITLPIGGIIPNLERLLGSKGFDTGTSVELAGIIGLSVLIGRPVGGWLIDRFWAPAVAFLLLSAPAAAFLIIAHTTLTMPLAAFCVFLVGFASGVEYDVVAYLVSRYFGMRAYSAIYGCLYVAFALGAGFGPYLIGREFTVHHSYDGALSVGAGVLLLGAALLLTLGRYPTFLSGAPRGRYQAATTSTSVPSGA
jgi:MFS family permease